MPGAPNPEAIAWYLERSEALLNELHEHVFLLRARGGQIAGFSGAVLALAGANVQSVLDGLHAFPRVWAGVSLLVGMLMLVGALVTALRGTLVPQVMSDISAREVANYGSERFTHEPDLWRIHLRAISGLLGMIESTTRQGDEAIRIVRKAEQYFVAGLLAVGVAFATLIVVVTF